ncbi:Bug family tripartite tricarboxylate transporter substrate binding protein [Delftia tsuruhatensis]|uniref:Bug family tripartite tricarboxylate transporter substrate binding protein n=1 Tax=Delftia TaxID=80865 RepID=UPI0012A8B7D8|nr:MULTISPECIES: tripartite tricarboxylate transporter substrate binding protein [Delftia]MDH0421441.1 tripartite tricarboxylate transporter substrate binding protein [Delftia tsuruhatensis]QFS65373.1 tripartite tricarboxylate transporter substrate binding protein [Delftia tsuruhatensis]WON86950.1 tripartite tricarboxylate transporter substrate binding protein [Delftia sp. UGAL515B_04]
MTLHRRQGLTIAALAFATAVCGPAFAQDYPARPITVVVAYPAGGDTDAMARLFAEKLTVRLRQPVVVDNRPGAGGTVGNNLVARAVPDGYTLLFTPNPFTIAPMVMRLPTAATYDPLRGFTPVVQTASQAVLLVAHPSTGFKSVADMVAAAKAGKTLSYASPGAGSPMHIGAEWLNRVAGVSIQHVPYRGVAPAVNDVAAGHVGLAYVTLGPVAQYIQAGKLRALAVTDPKRSPLLPDVPSLAELGYRDIAAGAWNGFFAPKGTPTPVVQTLNTHLNEILRMPEVAAKMATFGAVPVGGSPQVLADVNAADYERLGKVIRELGITAE